MLELQQWTRQKSIEKKQAIKTYVPFLKQKTAEKKIQSQPNKHKIFLSVFHRKLQR